MATDKLTKLELQKAFCEIRKAHRLIYEYQRRMIDLTWFIKNKLGFNRYKGYKRFSSPVNRQEISNNNWAWDWIDSYAFEYWIGNHDFKNYKCGLSLIQVTDTGFYDSTDDKRRKTNLNTFKSVDDSDSKLLFYLFAYPKTEKENWNPDFIIDNYATKNEITVKDDENREGCFYVVYPVSLSQFVDEESTMTFLRDFVKYCNDNFQMGLTILE